MTLSIRQKFGAAPEKPLEFFFRYI